MGIALREAKAYIAHADRIGVSAQFQHESERLLTALVAEIEAAKVVHVDGVVRYVDGSVSVCTTPKLTDVTLRRLLGQRVRLLPEGDG